MQNLFKKESHYMWMLVLIVSTYVLYMTYFFPRDWADTPSALAIIDKIAAIVPALKNLQHHVPPYTNYWGMFYAIFWITAPVYWLLGFVGSFFLSPYRYERLVVNSSIRSIWVMLILFSMLVLYVLSLPILSFGIFINQLSNFWPKLFLSWFSTAGCFYGQARIIGVLVLKSKLTTITN